jgi:DNA polymerase-3 subunit gamma/tau
VPTPVPISTPLEQVAPLAEIAAPPANIPSANSTAAAEDGDPQRAVIEALAAAKHSSAADAMADAVWTIADGVTAIQTELSKVMLATVINAEAEKIVRETLRAAGMPRFTLLPGTNNPANPAAPKKAKPARSGSAHAKALEHPMVQAAQKLFDAEIQTVIDLRED